MGKRLLIITICALNFMGCGDQSRSSRRSHTTDLSTAGAPNRENSPTGSEHDAREDKTANDLLIQQERTMKMRPYEMPKKLRERLKTAQPDLVYESSKDFQVFNQHLKISSREGIMTFTGVLRVTGKPDEAFEMSCPFDKSQPTWSCTEMVPTNEAIAKQQRLQATVECFDPPTERIDQKCDQTSLELYVVIGKETHKQLFQTGKFSVRIGTSGDSEYSENDDSEQPMTEDGKDEIPADKPKVEDRIPKDQNKPVIEEKPTRTNEKFTNRVNQPTESKANPKPTLPSPAPTQAKDEGTTEIVPNINDEDDESEEGEEDEVSDEELETMMDDPNVVLEMTPAMLPPSPTAGKYSIPNIEKLRPHIGTGVRIQAIDFHNRGRLQQAAKMPDHGNGFQCRSRRKVDTSYGTDLMVELLSGSTGKVWEKYSSRPPFIIADIAQKEGGRLGRHKSHQTGLDADIAFPTISARNSGMWPACPVSSQTVNSRGRTVGKKGCAPGSGVIDQFDEERFWLFVSQMTCADNKPVVAMFIDREIKRHMCRWADKRYNLKDKNSCAYKVLQAMKHEPSHYNHVHVRLRCPENRRCRYVDIPAVGTGC